MNIFSFSVGSEAKRMAVRCVFAIGVECWANCSLSFFFVLLFFVGCCFLLVVVFCLLASVLSFPGAFPSIIFSCSSLISFSLIHFLI